MSNQEHIPEPGITKSISYRQVVDLSHPIHPGIPRWPGDPPVMFQDAVDRATQGYYLRRFSMGEHTGTHLNAPIAFHPGGAGVEAIDVTTLVAPAIVIDVRGQVAGDQNYALTPAEVEAWEQKHGRIAESHLVLLLTGWSERWHNPRAYFGYDNNSPQFPGFGSEAAVMLLAERKAAGLGTDTPGVEPGQDTEFQVNKLALASQRIVLENLTNLDQMPPLGATLVIGILRLIGGSGSPVSALALIP